MCQMFPNKIHKQLPGCFIFIVVYLNTEPCRWTNCQMLVGSENMLVHHYVIRFEKQSVLDNTLQELLLFKLHCAASQKGTRQQFDPEDSRGASSQERPPSYYNHCVHHGTYEGVCRGQKIPCNNTMAENMSHRKQKVPGLGGFFTVLL